MSWAVAVFGRRGSALFYQEYQTEEQARDDYALMLCKYKECEVEIYEDEED